MTLVPRVNEVPPETRVVKEKQDPLANKVEPEGKVLPEVKVTRELPEEPVRWSHDGVECSLREHLTATL